METSQKDYNISLSDVVFINRIRRNNCIVVYTAFWRHQLVFVKEIIGEERSVFNEIRVLTKCIHPKIVQFLGFSNNFMFFEYMEHGDLQEYISKHKTMITRIHKVNMMKDITIALHYLHNRRPNGVIHRDLKPQNILVNKNGDVKLADFDVSKLVETSETDKYKGHTGETGTYVWTSPEVLRHETYNYTADIYSLGLLFYYVWTCKTPFEHLQMCPIQIAFAKIQNTIQIPIISEDLFLSSIIQQCCIYDKNKRPSTELVIGLLNKIPNLKNL